MSISAARPGRWVEMFFEKKMFNTFTDFGFFVIGRWQGPLVGEMWLMDRFRLESSK
jgi:hypothetical protein